MRAYRRPLVGVVENWSPDAEAVIIRGKVFTPSLGLNPDLPGFLGHLREYKPRGAQHAYVFRQDGRIWYAIDHVDDYHPHWHPIRHFFADVCGG